MSIVALLLYSLTPLYSIEAHANEPLIVLGKGIYLRETDEMLQLACTDASCEKVQFAYSSPSKNTKFIGPSIALSLPMKVMSPENVVKEVLNHFSIEKDVKEEVRSHVFSGDTGQKNKYRPLTIYYASEKWLDGITWTPPALTRAQLFVSQKALDAFAKTQEIHWQFKPEKASLEEFKQLYGFLAHEQLPSQPKNKYCEFGRVKFDIWARGHTLAWMSSTEAKNVFFENQGLTPPWKNSADMVLDWHKSNTAELAIDFMAKKFIEQKSWAYFEPHAETDRELWITYSAKVWNRKYVYQQFGKNKVKRLLGKQCIVAQISDGGSAEVCGEPRTDLITPVLRKLAQNKGCL